MAGNRSQEIFDSPGTLSRQLFGQEQHKLPEEFALRVISPVPRVVRNLSIVRGLSRVADKALWSIDNRSRQQAYAGGQVRKKELDAFSGALEDVLPKKSLHREFYEQHIEPLGSRRIVRYPRNTLRTIGLLPIPLGGFIYPNSPVPFPSINVSVPFLGGKDHVAHLLNRTVSLPFFDFQPHTFSLGNLHATIPFFTSAPHALINNPPNHLPLLITANAVAALLGFGFPNAIRAISERKGVRAIFYGALHTTDVFAPAVITNSFFWDLPLRYRDNGVKHGRLKVLEHGLRETKGGTGRQQVRMRIVEQAEKQATDSTTYPSRLAIRRDELLQRSQEQVAIYYRSKTQLEKKSDMRGQKLPLRLLTAARAWKRRNDVKGEMEDAREDAVRSLQLAQTVGPLLDIISAASAQ